MPLSNDKEVEQRVADALQKAIDAEKRNQRLIQSIGPAIVQMLSPVLQKMADNVGNMTNEFKQAAKEIKVNVNPEVKLPDIHVPTPEVTVKVPRLKAPNVTVKSPPMTALVSEIRAVKKAVSEMQFPEGFNGEMDIFKDVSMKRPLPVIMATPDGKPWFPMGSKGGGGAVNVRFQETDARDRLTSYRYPLPIHIASAGSNFSTSVSFASGTLVQTRQVSGSSDSTNVIQLGGQTIALNRGVTNAGTLRVVQAVDSVTSVNIVSGSSAGTEYNETATADPGVGGLQMAKDSAGSVYAHRVGSGTSETALRVIHAVDAVMSVNIVSGSATGTEYTEGETASPGDGGLMMARDSAGSISVARVGSGTSEVALRVLMAVDSVASVNIVSGSTGGTQYDDGGNAAPGTGGLMMARDSAGSVYAATLGAGDSVRALRIIQAVDSVSSVQATGNVAHDDADAGNPIGIGFQARTTNPAAVADADRVRGTADKLGRQMVVPYQMRDLRKTAYATLNTNTETTLLAAVAGAFLDLMYIKFSNTSSGAVTIDVRDSLAGSIVDTWEIPANASQGFVIPPYPQGNQGNAWTVDFNDADLSNTTVFVSALFSQEV